MTAAEENFHLLQEIEANRQFFLLAYMSNPGLLATAEPELQAVLKCFMDAPAGSAKTPAEMKP